MRMLNDLYQSQRAMRAMRQAAIQRGVIAVLDVGTSKIACLILKFDGRERVPSGEGIGAMAGQTKFRVIGAATTRSRGIDLGETVAVQETERAIRTAVQAAQKMANCRVDHVMACLSGGQPRSYGLAGQVNVSGDVVGETDIAHVLAACDVPDYGADREILHAQPVNFALDHRSGLIDPRDQIGQRLACDMHMLTVDTPVIENLIYCLRRCDLELAGLAISSYVSAISALVEDEQELGAACVDMGGGTTGLSIFMKRHMIYADAVRMGGVHVTQDISKGLQIGMAAAERIKTFHGGAVATGLDDRELIEAPHIGDRHPAERRTISRSALIGVIRPRLEEILEEVRERLDASGFQHMPARRIVLTGGGAQLIGVEEVAGRVLGQQVRIGKPMRIAGLPQATTGPGFSAAVGLALYAARPQDELWDFEPAGGFSSRRRLSQAVRWFRENW